MKKGDILEAEIEQYDFPNKGSFFSDGRKVTIKGALPGQKVRYMVTKKKSGMAEGRVLEVLENSPMENEEPTCPYFGQCGGCSYRTMSYENQLNLKSDMVKKLLDKVLLAEESNSKDYVWEGIQAAPKLKGYRNKMEFTFGDEYKDGPLTLGLHKKGNFYDILNVSGCEIIEPEWSMILDYTINYFKEHEVPFYHRMRHEGILRNLVVRQSQANGAFLINLVTSTQWEKYGFVETCGEGEEREASCADRGSDGACGNGAQACNENLKILRDYVAGLLALEKEENFNATFAGILYTENDTLGDVVQCDRIVTLYGKDYITEEILGLSFKISPFSFFQTNTKGCEVLYTKAREYIMDCSSMKGNGSDSGDVDGSVAGGNKTEGVASDKVVFDLYSGTGTIAQMMSPAAGKVIGIEIVEEAVEAAKENAALNGLHNCEFIAGDVLKAIDLVEDKPDMIILDPPRDGINPKALDKILAFDVEEMVYISCKPTSLARDLEIMINRGYKVVKACCVDEFPFTNHVETVVLITRKDK